MGFRYFLHQLSDWPLPGACNETPLGPDEAGLYLATLDASDPRCALYELDLDELTASAARAWVAGLPSAEGGL